MYSSAQQRYGRPTVTRIYPCLALRLDVLDRRAGTWVHVERVCRSKVLRQRHRGLVRDADKGARNRDSAELLVIDGLDEDVDGQAVDSRCPGVFERLGLHQRGVEDVVGLRLRPDRPD